MSTVPYDLGGRVEERVPDRRAVALIDDAKRTERVRAPVLGATMTAVAQASDPSVG